MANEKQRPLQAPPGKSKAKTPAKQQPKKSRPILTFLLVVFVLLLLGGGGFAAGVYMNLLDVQRFKLYEYPIIGQYFPKPPTNEEISDEITEQVVDPKPQSPAQPTATPATTPPAAALPADADKEKLAKSLKQEETKRISKVARLYGDMKPDEAVAIMTQLDDETVLAVFSKMEEEQVAKILALFEPKRSASLTKEMLKGKVKNL